MVQSKNNVLHLLTFNTHSLMNGDDDACLQELADFMIRSSVDVAAFQEVNQYNTAEPVSSQVLDPIGYVSCGCGHPIKDGNYAMCLARILSERGTAYSWTWTYAHIGYGRFDEGMALFSRTPIEEAVSAPVSEQTPDRVLKTPRKVLGIKTGAFARSSWFWCFHMGWWSDINDPFTTQWKNAEKIIASHSGSAWLLGDFNSPANRRNEGYDLICQSGFEDCFKRAEQRDDGLTVPGHIDGWRKGTAEAMRLDMIFARQPGRTVSSRKVFDGNNRRIISDHFGVYDIEENL
ncbi:MAG: endonuclease/exonuclease/phosphatase family protein [Clostridia bacterium]|nr:endonuclease/exonuclease/phosphatase family protein [Clostridia bacterium]